VVRTARILNALAFGLIVSICGSLGGESRAQHPGPAPGYTPGHASPPVVGGGVQMAPGATFQGGIESLPPDWDAWATQGSGAPTFMANDPNLDSFPPIIAEPIATMQPFYRGFNFDYHWLSGNGEGEFGCHDFDFHGTFAFPIFPNKETPLLVTPGFGLHLWSGPSGSGAPDMPPNAFDAYLDTAWQPQLTDVLSADLAFRIGVYSDFQRVTGDSIRYTGRGLGVFSFSPSVQLRAGVWYLDRVRVKILPAGGIVWKPAHGDAIYEFVFPNPKLARRLTTVGDTEWWWYMRGEYGGGSWTVKRESGMLDQADYNDIRFAFGLDFANLNGFAGMFEIGVAFEREIRYRSRMPEVYYPSTTFFLGTAFNY